MSSANDLTALSYTVDPIGKVFSDSKTRHTWTMDVDGETQVVVVTASWNSGKFVVEINGYERLHQIVKGAFTYSFKLKDRFFKVQQSGDQLALLIDTVAFVQYTAKAKAAQAALLKSYEAKAKNRSRSSSPPPQQSSREQSSDAFSGDLAKRLGKKSPAEPEGYYEQRDDEDETFFSAPVNIQSFVTAASTVDHLTIIPDLIELSDSSKGPTPAPEQNHEEKAPSGESTPVGAGQVTPREKISPSKLENPFAGLDELVVNKQTSDNPFL